MAEKLTDFIWEIVLNWNHLAKETVGIQKINSSDSIGSNIAEGPGKGSELEFKRYYKIARGSLFETKHWLRRSKKRKLMNENQIQEIENILKELLPKLSVYINYLENRIKKKK